MYGCGASEFQQIDGTVVTVSGHDLIDGTPVLDIKPYIHEYDSAPDSRVPLWLPPRKEELQEFDLVWSHEALQQLQETPLSFYQPHELELFKSTLRDLLKLNPRSKVRIHLLLVVVLQSVSIGRTPTAIITT